MKKKLTINALAIGNLKQRKKQYTILIIGIILAMVFSSGTMFFISCTKSSNEEFNRRTMGNFYGYYFACEDFVDVEQGKKDGLVESYGYAHILGYAYSDAEEIDKGTPVAWLDEEAKDLYYIHLIEGRYPETKGEIAIEKDAALRLGIKPAVGEEISFSMLTANYNNFLSTSADKTYTIVGIMTDKRKNFEKYKGANTPEFPAALVSSEETVDPGGKEILAVFFEPTKKALNETVKVEVLPGRYADHDLFFENFISPIYDKAKAVYGEDYDNNNIMYCVNTLSYETNSAVYNSALLSITLAVVLMLASCIGIINAFSANLKERKKQIGMLRAVGATRRQIINIFGREAFIISLICAPVSIFISYFGVKLYAKLMGDGFIFMPDFAVLTVTALVSVICVMLVVLIPLVSASKISPMQAIRNVELSRKMKRKKIKTQKSFIVPKLLANRSLKFYRSRQICVTLILIITIFISSFGFAFLKDESTNYNWDSFNTSDYVIRRNNYPDRTPYVNLPNIDKKINFNNIKDVLDYPMFKSAYGHKEARTYVAVDEYSDYMNLVQLGDIYSIRYNERSDIQTKDEVSNVSGTQELIDIWVEEDNEFYQKLKTNTQTTQEIMLTEIQGYDPIIIENNLEQFEVIDGKIDIDKLESGEEIILVAYENAGFKVYWDEKGRVYAYGLQDMDEEDELSITERNYYKKNNIEFEILATETLDLRPGDTMKLRTVYSDVTEVDFSTYNYIETKHLTVYEKEVKIGAIVKPFYFSETTGFYENFGIVTTSTGIDTITDQHHDYETLNIDFDGEITDETDNEATEYLNTVFAGSYFKAVSGYAQDKEDQQTVKILMISLLSIVILMFSICASIVNNALTAKIRESKKEIGTLRAVGASVKELTSVYIRQLVSMFAWGMSLGLGGYTVVHSGVKLYYKDSYIIPYLIWPSIVICVLLCIICSINLYAKIKGEMKHSIVENIREL